MCVFLNCQFDKASESFRLHRVIFNLSLCNYEPAREVSVIRSTWAEIRLYLLALVGDVYCIFVLWVWCLILSFPDLCHLFYYYLDQNNLVIIYINHILKYID